jgi:hypothetical protein
MNPSPTFDHRLIVEAQTLANAQNIHGLQSRIAVYKNNFALVNKCGYKWETIWAQGMTRAEYTEAVAKEIRAILTKSKLAKTH